MNDNLIMFDDLPDVLNAQQLAKALSISRAGAYKLLSQDDFPTLRIGSRKLVPKARLVLWIANRTGKCAL